MKKVFLSSRTARVLVSLAVAVAMLSGIVLQNQPRKAVAESDFSGSAVLSGSINWVDEEDYDGFRPDAVQLEIAGYVGLDVAVPATEVTVSADDGWAWSLEVPELYNGDTIEYCIFSVQTVDAYEPAVDGMDITYTHVLETKTLSGKVIWDDTNDNDRIRPEYVTVVVTGYVDYLIKIGSKEIKVFASDDWEWTCPVFELYHGKDLVYVIEYPEVPEGYTAVVDGMDIVNGHELEEKSISGSVIWDDTDDNDRIRPESVELEVAGFVGEEIVIPAVTVTVSLSDDWKWTLDVQKLYEGTEIEYKVAAPKTPEGYTVTADGLDVTDSHDLETKTVSGKVLWDDTDDNDRIRPDSVNVEVAGFIGEKIVIPAVEVTVKAADSWAWSLEVQKLFEGAEIEYKVVDSEVPEGYKASSDGLDVTNAHELIKKTISGSVAWDDTDDNDRVRPESVVVTVTGYAGDKVVIPAVEVTVKAADSWAWSLEVQKLFEGAEIEYKVAAEDFTGYTAAAEGLDVTNAHELMKKTVSGSVIWNDEDDNDRVRPESVVVTVTGYAGDKVVISAVEVTVKAADNWAWSLEVQKLFEGAEIEYKVASEDFTGYTAAAEGLDVTNTHEIEKIDLSGSMTWVDYDNQYKTRPESVVVRLLADGAEVASEEVTEEDGWAWTFEGLRKYTDGVEVVYTLAVDEVDKYATDIDGMDAINTLKENPQTGAGSFLTLTSLTMVIFMGVLAVTKKRMIF